MKYEEDYSNALKCFKRAQELDPTWDAPKNLEKILSKFLTDVKVSYYKEKEKVSSFTVYIRHKALSAIILKNVSDM